MVPSREVPPVLVEIYWPQPHRAALQKLLVVPPGDGGGGGCRLAEATVKAGNGGESEVAAPRPRIYNKSSDAPGRVSGRESARAAFAPPLRMLQLHETVEHTEVDLGAERVVTAARTRDLAVDLSEPSTHCRQRLVSVAQYRGAIASYCAQLAADTSMLEEAISGEKIPISDQAQVRLRQVAGSVTRAGYSDASSMAGLARALLAPSPERARGQHLTTPVLLISPAGTGKTWACSQLAHVCAIQCQAEATIADVPLVPVLIYAHRLASLLHMEDADYGESNSEGEGEGSDGGHEPRHGNAGPDFSRVMLEYLVGEYGGHGRGAGGREVNRTHALWLTMFAQALEIRSLVIIIDGLDEGVRKRAGR